MNSIPTDTDLATKADIAALGDRFDARMGGFDGRMGGFDARMGRFEARMDRFEARMDQFDARLDQFDARLERLEAHMVRFEDKLDGFHQALREQTRTYMLTMTGVMASFAAVIVATGILT